MGARVLAQGYLNRVAMPLLGDWLLPRWMRAPIRPRIAHFRAAQRNQPVREPDGAQLDGAWPAGSGAPNREHGG